MAYNRFDLCYLLFAMSHVLGGAEAQNRTADTTVFSRVLYQLSYLGG